jgi:hypothetical protein
MGYSPKHAKPFSARKDIVMSGRGLFGPAESGAGRHSADVDSEQHERALADRPGPVPRGARQ